jgi:phosphoserine phosphatase RsbU/P
MSNPFDLYHKKKSFFIIKNFVLLGIAILTIFVLNQFDLIRIEQGLVWLFFNICFIAGFFAINFPELKYIKTLLDLVSYFHASESHSLIQVHDNLQRLIYPKNFEDENYEVYSKIQPVTYLGGDIVNFTKDKDQNYWFAVGDASGHDLNSHLFSMMILTQMNLLVNRVETPMQVNSLINESLKDKASGAALTNYATLGVLKADKNGSFLHYGLHPNYILFRKSTLENEIIETSGHFIGIDVIAGPYFKPNAEQTNFSFQMYSGDILFCFTDGIYEQRNSDRKYFGYRLHEFIKTEDKSNSALFVEKLFKSVVDFAAGSIDDDMTMMIIKKK